MYPGSGTMMQIDTFHLLIITLLLAIFVTIRVFYLRRKGAYLDKELQSALLTLSSMQKELDSLRKEKAVLSDFDADLKHASIANSLQHPRQTLHERNRSGQTPERYQYVRNLTDKGISVIDISSILSISPIEAEQLVNLANLSKR